MNNKRKMKKKSKVEAQLHHTVFLEYRDSETIKGREDRDRWRPKVHNTVLTMEASEKTFH
jgi:hypothetical protein